MESLRKPVNKVFEMPETVGGITGHLDPRSIIALSEASVGLAENTKTKREIHKLIEKRLD